MATDWLTVGRGQVPGSEDPGPSSGFCSKLDFNMYISGELITLSVLQYFKIYVAVSEL